MGDDTSSAIAPMIVKGFTHRAVRIDVILDAHEPDPQVVERIEGPDQVRRASRKAVELPYHDAVDLAPTRRLNQPVQFRPRLGAPGDALISVPVRDIEISMFGEALDPAPLQIGALARG
jgi:hypothetical protein